MNRLILEGMDELSVGSLADLTNPDVGEVISRAHENSGFQLRCGCCEAEPRLITAGLSSGKVLLKRVDIAEHSETCWLSRERDNLVRELKRSPSILLGPAGRGDVFEQRDLNAVRYASAHYECFGEFARSAIAEGIHKAYGFEAGLANAKRTPNPVESFRQIYRQATSSPLANGEMVSDALSRLDLKLQLGVIEDPIQMGGYVSGFWNVAWVDSGKIDRQLLKVDVRIADIARRGIDCSLGTLSPPYLVMATKSADGALLSFFIQPVFLNRECLLPVDSDFERDCLAHLQVVSTGIILKPLIASVCTKECRAHWPDLASTDLRFKSDALLLCPSGSRFGVGEFLGFKKGTRPSYDARIDLRRQECRALKERGLPLRFFTLDRKRVAHRVPDPGLEEILPQFSVRFSVQSVRSFGTL